MSRIRFALVLVLLSLPGCLVVTCGSTHTFTPDEPERPRTGDAPPPAARPDSGAGAGATW